MSKNDLKAKEQAVKTRLAIVNLSDDALNSFSDAIFADTFETAAEFIERTAAEHVKNMPF